MNEHNPITEASEILIRTEEQRQADGRANNARPQGSYKKGKYGPKGRYNVSLTEVAHMILLSWGGSTWLEDYMHKRGPKPGTPEAEEVERVRHALINAKRSRHSNPSPQ